MNIKKLNISIETSIWCSNTKKIIRRERKRMISDVIKKIVKTADHTYIKLLCKKNTDREENIPPTAKVIKNQLHFNHWETRQ